MDKPEITQSQAGPVRSAERIAFVDILRGFAILGILIVNMYGFSGASSGAYNLGWPGTLDRIVIILSEFFIRAKFYSLFSFLFGWGMALQFSRAEAKGLEFRPVYVRRLLGLLLIGLIHGIFIWSGDILTTYALLGFLLLLFRKRSNKVLFLAAGLSLLWAIAITLPGPIMTDFREWYGQLIARIDWAPDTTNIYATGSYREITLERSQDFLRVQASMLYYIGNVFAMFLLGLYVGRRAIFRHVDDHVSLLRKVLVVGLVIGLLFNGLFVATSLWSISSWPSWVPADYHQTIRIGARTIGAPALMLFYVAAIILLTRRRAWYQRLAPMGNVGRMALTNYLLHSVILTLVFYSYGLGLYGEIGPTVGLILSLLLYSAQIRFSGWWLERYRYGPAEWLWRSLTYRRWQPLRRGSVWLADGQSEEMPGDSWLARHRRSSGRAAGLIISIIVLIALLLVVLSFLQVEEDGEDSFSFVQAPAGQQPVPTPMVPTGFHQPEQPADGDAVAVEPPETRPAVYRPGPLAASGDLLALAEAFDGQIALTEIAELTNEQTAGRLAGSPGGWHAGQYIADQFAAYGLQPAGDAGTYFQAFGVETLNLADARLAVTKSGGAMEDGYRLNEDFQVVAGGYTGAGTGEGQVIWLNACKPEDFAGQDVVGKVLLCRTDTPSAAGRFALEHGAAGLLLLTDPVTWTAPSPWPLDVGQIHRPLWIPEPLALPAFIISPDVAEDLLAGSGRTVADLTITYEPLSLRTTARLEVIFADAPLCNDSLCQARNILGVLPGRDPSHADEVVIISGHYDHLGEAPDGTFWPGANDNASAISILLEIARSWQEQGFVPRRTVLFAAWDAGEVDRLGSSHYVAFPRYPLDKTVDVLVLEQLGAGGPNLVIDSLEGAPDPVSPVAAGLGITVTTAENSNYDHLPFLEAEIPTQLIAWEDNGVDQVPINHRPVDTAAVIEAEKLETAGEVVGLTLLGLAEGVPAIEDLALQREAAVVQDDMQAFLQSSSADRRDIDQHWFESVQQLNLLEFTVDVDPVVVEGHQASGRTRLMLVYPDPAGQVRDDGQVISRTLLLDYEAQFRFESSGWHWAGARLLPDGGEGIVNVFGPPDELEDLAGLDTVAENNYWALTELLNMPADSLSEENGITLHIYPDDDAMRADVDVNLVGPAFVGPGQIRILHSSGLSQSIELQDSIVQLVLADAGVTRAGAPDLWNGLGPVVNTASARAESRRQSMVSNAAYLADLAQAKTEDGQALAAETGAWASTDYLRRQLDWFGLGQFIVDLGRSCQGQCLDSGAFESTLQNLLGLNFVEYSAAWQQDWTDRLAAAQADLDELLAERQAAVLANDKEAFLVTVDPAISHLIVEEEHWFNDFRAYPVQSFDLSGRPLVIGDDGQVLAQVNMVYELAGGPSGSHQMEALLTPGDLGLRWAGVPLEVMRGPTVELYYPTGDQELAESVLIEAEAMVSQLQRELGIGFMPAATTSTALTISGQLTPTTNHVVTGTVVLTEGTGLEEALLAPAAVTVKLFGRSADFRYSIALSMPQKEWLTGWTAAGESVRLSPQADRGALAVQLTRQLLHQAGVETEWLRKGMPVYLARTLGVPELQYVSSSELNGLIYDAGRDELLSLADLPGDVALDEEGWQKITAQAWDSLAYLARRDGPEALLALLEDQSAGLSVDESLTMTAGQSLVEFEASWLDSLRQAHLQEEWLPMTDAVDETILAEHLSQLTTDEMAGRATGSPGARLAAEYISSQFAAYGLQPAGPDSSYYQPFPVHYTTLLAAPTMSISPGNGEPTESFAYRQDFLLPLDVILAGGQASGPLVLVVDGSYSGMDLRGKIVVRRPTAGLPLEIEAARSHGAAGLILLSDLDYEGDFTTKSALPISDTQVLTMPVIFLTQPGYERLLLAAGHTPVSFESGPPARPLDLKADLNVPLSQPEEVEVANVLGLLPGSDPLLRDEVIIVGAHYDHVGDDPDLWLCDGQPAAGPSAADSGDCQPVPGLRYPGINDNATGVAAMLEIARLWQETGFWPDRTVLFAAWVGQEAGQVGSRYYVNNPTLPLENTVGMMQLDALGAGDGRRLLGIGEWDTDGSWLFPMDTIEPYVDGRLRVAPVVAEATTTLPFGRPARVDMGSDDMAFRELGLPALRLMWQDADETNLPDELLDEVNLAYVRTAVQAALLILMINAN